jgi:hypothetical protein
VRVTRAHRARSQARGSNPLVGLASTLRQIMAR